MRFLVVALAALLAFLGFKCVTVRKDLVSERQAIDADWAEVDRALTARAALEPDLAAAIEAESAVHPEARIEKAVAAANDARQALAAAHDPRDRIKANNRLGDILADLLLLVQENPKLEKNKRYTDVLETLKGAEYQIAVARRKYNEAVEHYNARLDLFPDNLVAAVTRLGQIDTYFQTPAI